MVCVFTCAGLMQVHNLGSNICSKASFSHTNMQVCAHTHTSDCSSTYSELPGDCMPHTNSQPNANLMRKRAHASAYRDTRQLRRRTWLPKDPEAHVNSSLLPALGLCILTKHLAVSAPVHHSRDPAHPPPRICLCMSGGCIQRKLHCTL